MTITDERILEYLYEEGEASAWMIAFDRGTETQYVGHRCHELANADLVHVIRRAGLGNLYEISFSGMLYLAGELDTELRHPDENSRPPEAVRPSWYAGFG